MPNTYLNGALYSFKIVFECITPVLFTDRAKLVKTSVKMFMVVKD
jgi:hypothetical protein